MREIFRRHQDLLPASIDLMLVARSQVNNWPFAQIDRAFTDACGRMAPPSLPPQ
jgi:ribonuclease P protein component